MSQQFTHPVAEALVRAGVITREQLSSLAGASNAGSAERLDEMVVRVGLADEEQVYAAIGRHLGLEYVPKLDREISPALLSLVPGEFAMRHQVLPLCEEDHTLVVAAADPFDVTVFDDLRLLTSKEVRPWWPTRDTSRS